ncbi:ras family small GTPase [Naegleria gruberi]|uniref:Ras family small GTPase n=1 Tax=Naegleria gruberi TaxID=5762 RepID=D2VXE0_NAEGR|nr:ras family small GTPase [Naegleria gruberi]EFC38492.1 ras family small GTPase [Naegleria gruberi]|eukprot:XP_002671236.1 ras family small GTPase [Naegleria gruberi strain NEG-M]
MQNCSTQFLSLPSEILQHILEFGTNLLSIQQRSQEIKIHIKFILNFQSLNRKISSMPEMTIYFDKFWWKVWETCIGYNPLLENEFSLLKDEIVKGELKRKVLIAIFIKFNICKQPWNKVEETKIVMIGAGGVGKSSITINCFHGHFIEFYDPTTDEPYRKLLQVDNLPVMIDVIDPAGIEDYSAMTDYYMRSGDTFINVCDVVDEKTVEQSERVVEQVIKLKCREINYFPVIFALNKVDLLNDSNREQVIEKYTNLINSIIERNQLKNTAIFTSSAKTGENTKLLFEECVRRNRYGSNDNLTLLKEIVKYDSKFIEISKKQMKKRMKQSKNCLL